MCWPFWVTLMTFVITRWARAVIDAAQTTGVATENISNKIYQRLAVKQQDR